MKNKYIDTIDVKYLKDILDNGSELEKVAIMYVFNSLFSETSAMVGILNRTFNDKIEDITEFTLYLAELMEDIITKYEKPSAILASFNVTKDEFFNVFETHHDKLFVWISEEDKNKRENNLEKLN